MAGCHHLSHGPHTQRIRHERPEERPERRSLRSFQVCGCWRPVTAPTPGGVSGRAASTWSTLTAVLGLTVRRHPLSLATGMLHVHVQPGGPPGPEVEQGFLGGRAMILERVDVERGRLPK